MQHALISITAEVSTFFFSKENRYTHVLNYSLLMLLLTYRNCYFYILTADNCLSIRNHSGLPRLEIGAKFPTNQKIRYCSSFLKQRIANTNTKPGGDGNWKAGKGIWQSTADCNSAQQDTEMQETISSGTVIICTIKYPVAISLGLPASLEKGCWCGRASLCADVGSNQRCPGLPCPGAHPAPCHDHVAPCAPSRPWDQPCPGSQTALPAPWSFWCSPQTALTNDSGTDNQ